MGAGSRVIVDTLHTRIGEVGVADSRRLRSILGVAPAGSTLHFRIARTVLRSPAAGMDSVATCLASP